MAKTKPKMTKDIVPEGFSYALAAVDLLPVIFFGGTGVLLGLIVGSPVVGIAASLCFVSGLFKVLWKFIVIAKRKNVWWMFLQMRILMPIGMAALILGLCLSESHKGAHFLQSPQVLLFALGIGGMGLMGYLGTHLDSADPKSNRIEQLTNTFAQMCIFAGVLIVYLSV